MLLLWTAHYNHLIPFNGWQVLQQLNKTNQPHATSSKCTPPPLQHSVWTLTFDLWPWKPSHQWPFTRWINLFVSSFIQIRGNPSIKKKDITSCKISVNGWRDSQLIGGQMDGILPLTWILQRLPCPSQSSWVNFSSWLFKCFLKPQMSGPN